MSKLKIIKNGHSQEVFFDGEVALDTILNSAGITIPHPCSGRGNCGKCAVELFGSVSEPNEIEKRFGNRLSCQTTLLGDATIILPNDDSYMQIESGTAKTPSELNPMPGKFGCAVDIGTTTVVVKAYELETGKCIATVAAPNPQISVASDIVGRIDAALNGKLLFLQNQITETIKNLMSEAFPNGAKPDSMVLTGNTTMLYLLCGIEPDSLSRPPFEADNLFGINLDMFCASVYLPPCMNAFVGADITCALLASGMCDSTDTALLCDIGTNGEIALWKNGTIYVTSTAAGPAFEGYGITCGCSSVRGAIDSVELQNNILNVHTVGESKSVGICGSGLIDAVAVGLKSGLIDKTGFMSEEFKLTSNISLQPRDIRAVQLAKSAVSAGIETLLEVSNTDFEEIKALYIAGGFGSKLKIESAVAIGLLPIELSDRICVLGNAAISGAANVLLNTKEKSKLEQIAGLSKYVSLGGNPSFNKKFIDNMYF